MRSGGGGGGGRAAKCLEVCSENVRLPECNTEFCHQPSGSSTINEEIGCSHSPLQVKCSFIKVLFTCKIILGLAEQLVILWSMMPDMRRGYRRWQSDRYISLFIVTTDDCIIPTAAVNDTFRSDRIIIASHLVLYQDHTDIEGTHSSLSAIRFRWGACSLRQAAFIQPTSKFLLKYIFSSNSRYL